MIRIVLALAHGWQRSVARPPPRPRPPRRGSRSWSRSARKSCASAISSRTPAPPPTCRCSARRTSARPAPCRSRASSTRCGPMISPGSIPAGLNEVVVTRLSRAHDRQGHHRPHRPRAVAGQYGLGDAQNLAVILDRDVRILHVEPTVGGDLVVSRMNVDPRTGRFDIAFELPGSTLSRRCRPALHRHGDRDRRGGNADALAPHRRSRQGIRRHDRAPAQGRAARRRHGGPIRRSAWPPRPRCATARRSAPTT